jgi:DNA-binding IclR family transcriptional regulator
LVPLIKYEIVVASHHAFILLKYRGMGLKPIEKHTPTKSTGQQAEKEKDRQFVAALAKGLDVLRCFTRATPALGTTEIARMTGLPQPTVWRLCHTLMQEGYLVQTERGDKLRPGIPVLSLGYAAIAGLPIIELAREEMQAIAYRYQVAVVLGMCNGLEIIYLQICQAPLITYPAIDVGVRVSIASSPTGWGYLAGLSEAEREALYNDLSSAKVEGWPELLPKIKEALNTFAHTGYVVNKSTIHEQIYASAVPVSSLDGSVRMALSAGGIRQVVNDEKLMALGSELKQLAARLAPTLHAHIKNVHTPLMRAERTVPTLDRTAPFHAIL